ncbi:E3 ubiquitin-protein ligase TRIM71-like [Lingula anatina]|uniref:E3 ubiquitin-protein ligase TRIM71-like n=1 Tax=Lingula anatina TaxID=7574 RepID=A0A2R2MT71_LINAN|nr:E3 ubiquitin-protein ligase TRIM71-like [Lingula anatina]|eukprot:XP_023933444.1 E3 ubiquitin-protein ligase TRIM71-like [Lingula anatina]
MAASINKIKDQAQRIRRLVDQREQIMISEVFSACDIRKKQVGANKETLELHHASLHSACNFAQELLTNGSASDIMIHTKALTERLTAMEKMPVPAPDTPTQISYSPGKISRARLDAMLGQVKIKSKPHRLSSLEENLPNPRSAPHLPFFLEKAGCMHSFNPKLKYDKSMSVSGLAIDEQHMYLVDNSNNRTKVFTHEGQFKLQIKLNGPFDVAVSQNGQLYITSLGDQCVQVYSIRGQQVTTMGQGLLGRPYGVTLNRQGHVMVCDKGKKSIFTFHADSGQLLNTFPLSMCKLPMYITVNSVNENIVISDWGNDCLYQYGNTEGSGVGQLRLPRGVCTDSYGHIFIADNGNHRIVALSPQGQFTRYIATEEDGLKYPRALAINPAGQLVVAEGRGQVKTFQNLQ